MDMKHDEALLGTREGCTMMALRAFWGYWGC